MFELQVLLINVGLPAFVVLLAAFAAHKLGATAECNSARSIAANNILTVAAVVAFGLAFGLRNPPLVGTFTQWHEDAWMRIPLAMALVGLAGIVGEWLPWLVMRWLIRLAVVALAAWVVFPQGEAWEFLLPTRTFWLAAITVACFASWLAATFLAAKQSGVLGFGWIAIFAAAAFLTIQSFARVTEPLLAVSAIVGCSSLAAFLQRRAAPQFLVAVTGPCLFAFAAAVASAQFNSFLGLPDWLSWLAMLGPALAATVSLCVRRTSAKQSENPEGASLRAKFIAAAVVGCLAMALAIVLLTLAWAPSGEEW